MRRTVNHTIQNGLNGNKVVKYQENHTDQHNYLVEKENQSNKKMMCHAKKCTPVSALALFNGLASA